MIEAEFARVQYILWRMQRVAGERLWKIFQALEMEVILDLPI
jgi:hypothetical protein